MHHKCAHIYCNGRTTKSSIHVNSSNVLCRWHTQVSCLCESVKINNVSTHQCTKFIYKGTHSCSAAKNEVNHVKNEASCCKTMPLFHSDTLYNNDSHKVKACQNDVIIIATALSSTNHFISKCINVSIVLLYYTCGYKDSQWKN